MHNMETKGQLSEVMSKIDISGTVAAGTTFCGREENYLHSNYSCSDYAWFQKEEIIALPLFMQ